MEVNQRHIVLQKFPVTILIRGPGGVVVSVLASQAGDRGSNPGSGRNLTGISLVDSCQSNVMSTTIKRQRSSHSCLNVCLCNEAGYKCQIV